MTDGSSPPGWYQDPTGQSEGRYWNGSAWTQMSNQGGRVVDVPIDPSMAEMPPVPGTQVQPPPAPQTGASSSGSSGGVVIAVVIGLLLLLAVFVAVDDDTTGDTPAPDGTAPAEPAPADTRAPAPEE